MDDELVVFIMVWGRPDKMWTYQSLRKHGYTGKIYFIADDMDEKLQGYKDKYSEDLIVYSKNEVKNLYDSGDNSGDLRSTLYSANYIREIAKKLDYKYYFIFCDDYTDFRYKMNSNYEYIDKADILNLDIVFSYLLEYFKSIPAKSLAIAQGGDYIGGEKGGGKDIDKSIHLRRKVMNTFLCSIERPYNFLGRMNEDVTTYVNLGNKGYLFLTFPLIAINQLVTQSHSGGLTGLYLDYGTYVKSFFSVMYNPSCVKISALRDRKIRVHHRVEWNNAVPMIIKEKYRKASITN